ncbi:MAG: FG-GAP repeat protein [Alphaproteobacteria bacterium]|nr:FG-GAP repeat protein [Alphaproteobacteria bacterium]
MKHWVAILLLTFLVACLTSREEYALLEAMVTDADGDGFLGRDDCNDGDATIHPGAVEIWYDGVDQDCAEDDDFDADVDGFPLDEDCDDTDDDIHPGATEVCNGLDDDCDGVVDDGLLFNWYPDSDGDGQGATTGSVRTCLAPEGYVEADGDCDDADPRVFDGAEEICNDGVVNDCSGSATACRLLGDVTMADLGGALAGHRLDGDDDVGGRMGDAVAFGGVDGDGRHLVLGAPWAPLHTDDVGYVYVIGAGLAADQYVGDVALAIIHGEEPGTELGTGVAWIEGMAGQTSPLIAATGFGGTNTTDGVLYLVDGDVRGTRDLSDVLTASLSHGDDLDDVAADGDLTGDGAVELVVGVSDDAGLRGSVFLVDAVPAGAASLEDATAHTLRGDSASDQLGAAVSNASDLNGDGVADLAVGAPGVATRTGALLVFLGPVQADLVASDADGALSGERAGDEAGTALAGGGDVDGDGLDDLLVGVEGAQDGSMLVGRAYVVRMDDLSSGSLTLATARVSGDQDGSRFAESVALSDLDGDGFADVVVAGSLRAEVEVGGGGVHVCYGPLGGNRTTQDSDLIITSESSGDRMGTSVAGGRDANGDGVEDLLVGAPLQGGQDARRGAAYLLLGSGP